MCRNVATGAVGGEIAEKLVQYLRRLVRSYNINSTTEVVEMYSSRSTRLVGDNKEKKGITMSFEVYRAKQCFSL